MNVRDLVEAGDLNGLLRAVDGLVAARDWEGLVSVADLCEDALERGKQLWPIAMHVDYRLALDAPAEYAASVLDIETRRFVPGPLTEVAASTHSWAELAPHIEDERVAAYVAQERVLRGEDLSGDDRAHPELLGLPLALESWEPTYRLAVYRSDHVEIPEPWDPKQPLEEVDAAPGAVLDDEELQATLLDLVAPWTNESTGAAAAVVVEGDARGATSRLTFESLRMGELTPAEAIQQMAWAASVGGVYGRRRGAALGRFLAWSAGAAFRELAWPVDPDELGRGLASLGWYRWDEGQPEPGWIFCLAVEDLEMGWAAAIAASDSDESDDSGTDAL